MSSCGGCILEEIRKGIKLKESQCPEVTCDVIPELMRHGQFTSWTGASPSDHIDHELEQGPCLYMSLNSSGRDGLAGVGVWHIFSSTDGS